MIGVSVPKSHWVSQKGYNRPCLIHQMQVHAILDAPSIEEVNGKDLRRLYCIANQHLQTLMVTKQDMTESFIMSMLELKLDQATMFEWQRHSQNSNNVSHYSALLEFLDLRAQASENFLHESESKRRTPTAECKCYLQTPSYAVNVDHQCVACKLGRHPLYACKNFKPYHMSKL